MQAHSQPSEGSIAAGSSPKKPGISILIMHGAAWKETTASHPPLQLLQPPQLPQPLLFRCLPVLFRSRHRCQRATNQPQSRTCHRKMIQNPIFLPIRRIARHLQRARKRVICGETSSYFALLRVAATYTTSDEQTPSTSSDTGEQGILTMMPAKAKCIATTSFEPPSLPPTPTAMGTEMT